MSDRNLLPTVLACRSLPSLPTVGVQVLTLTRDPDVSMDQIARVIETDPALSVKVLKTVNSSVYGLKSPCTTIRRALNFLGLAAVKSIVLGFSLVESTRGVSGNDAFDINDHWRRSIFGAAAARIIAQRVGGCDPEEAFAAALFQDLGVLAMFTALGTRYTDALASSPHRHAAHARLELAALGFTHAQCGAALAGKWRLPDRYVQAILHHHDPDRADPDCRMLVRVVSLGTLTAAALGSADTDAQLPELLAASRVWFDLSSEDMAQLLTQIGQASGALARLFGKQVGAIPDSATLMQQASEELVNQQIAASREALLLREKNEALARQTLTDALTGISNRKHFNDEAERLFAESAAIGRPLALAICDADKFKSVNDTHGHHVGDAVLKELASRLSSAVGPAAITCRYGGEEFALLLPGTTLDEAAALAEQARKAVQTPAFDLSAIRGAPASLAITISIGVACTDAAGTGAFPTLAAVVEAADKALYTAKHAGRNRVCVEKAPATSVPATPSRGAPPAPAGPARLLLVEDDSLAARMILAVMQKVPGIETEWVKSVPAAVNRIAEGASSDRAIRAIVSDLTIVGGTGLDVLSAIRTDVRFIRIPIAIISATDDAATQRRCVSAGASAFISKDNLLQHLPAWITGALADFGAARAA